MSQLTVQFVDERDDGEIEVLVWTDGPDPIFVRFPSETAAQSFAARLDSIEPEDLDQLVHHFGGYVW